jgi:hypothetical protein
VPVDAWTALRTALAAMPPEARAEMVAETYQILQDVAPDELRAVVAQRVEDVDIQRSSR